MHLLIISNIHRPLHTASSGMEISTYEFLEGIAEIAPEYKINVTVMCHPATKLPKNLSHWKVCPSPCDPNYLKYGEGLGKWQNLAIEVAFQKALNNHQKFSIVHDQSSAFTPTAFFSQTKIPFVRTMRLMPYHPTYSLVTGSENGIVHLSEYALKKDIVTSTNLRTVIRDYVSISQSVEKTAIPVLPVDYALSIGRVDPRKGHHIAAKIAENKCMKLVIIGEVVDKKYSQTLIKKEGVKILGPVNRNIALELLRKAKLLLWFPTVPETSGRVVVEALKLGTPVLGYKTGVLYDLWKKKLAITYDKNIVYTEGLLDDWPTNKKEVALAYLDIYRKLA
jgi:glycosyltransferase involved in cell wall biosynthesis